MPEWDFSNDFGITLPAFDEEQPLCQPVLRYDLELPIDVPLRVFLPKLKELAMEDPLLGL